MMDASGHTSSQIPSIDESLSALLIREIQQAKFEIMELVNKRFDVIETRVASLEAG